MTRAMPKVVVITRTKNRPLLLERAIKTVMAQSYKDFGMIIVNDGGAVAPITQLLNKHKDLIDSRIKLINNKESAGMQNAANTGIESSDSVYIALLDDDDSWDKEFLATTINFLEKSSYEGVVTASNVVEEEVEGQQIKEIKVARFAPFIKSINYFSILGVNQFPNNSFVYSRKAFDQIGSYDQKLNVLGDWDFNVRFMKLYDIAFINEPLANYHHRYNTQGANRNSINTSEHDELTSQVLNHSLRSGLKDYGGAGLAANISNQMHRLRMDSLGEVHGIHHSIDGLNERLSHIEKRLDTIEYLTSSFEKRLARYIRGIPKRAIRRITRPVLGDK